MEKNKGVFLIHRDVFEHTLFADEPYTEREAWIWMISVAYFDDATKPNRGSKTLLKRGQFSHSLRFMAKKFQWSFSRVRRLLDRLERNRMIETANETGQNVITICNYTKFQDWLKKHETLNETKAETANETVSETGGMAEIQEPLGVLETVSDTKQRNSSDTKKNTLNTLNNNGNVVSQNEYAWSGDVIRLNQSDYNKWKTACSAIVDFNAELLAADTYYSQNPPKKNQWFFPVFNWLKKAHAEALTKAEGLKANRLPSGQKDCGI